MKNIPQAYRPSYLWFWPLLILGGSVISAGTIHYLRRVKVPGTGPLWNPCKSKYQNVFIDEHFVLVQGKKMWGLEVENSILSVTWCIDTGTCFIYMKQVPVCIGATCFTATCKQYTYICRIQSVIYKFKLFPVNCCEGTVRQTYFIYFTAGGSA